MFMVSFFMINRICMEPAILMWISNIIKFLFNFYQSHSLLALLPYVSQIAGFVTIIYFSLVFYQRIAFVIFKVTCPRL